MAELGCTFCEIIDGDLPSRKIYEDDQIFAFHNQLDWVPVMLLLVPKEHLAQDEMWSSGALLGKMGALAAELGNKWCPDGFRILSNFGSDAMQSQIHAHLHVVGGAHLGLYVRRGRGRF